MGYFSFLDLLYALAIGIFVGFLSGSLATIAALGGL